MRARRNLSPPSMSFHVQARIVSEASGRCLMKVATFMDEVSRAQLSVPSFDLECIGRAMMLYAARGRDGALGVMTAALGSHFLPIVVSG